MLDRLTKDMIAAMKSGEKERLSTIRMVKSQIDLAKIEKKRELNDDEIIAIVAKQIKMRKESIAEFEKANRQDLIDKTQSEIEMLQVYLPEQLSKDALEQIIEEAFQTVQPAGVSDMGKLMKEVKEKVKGRADMGLVNQMIKSRLQ